MTPMSDKSKREYTLLKSQVYMLAPRAKRKAILTEYCAVTEHKPSYARKLLKMSASTMTRILKKLPRKKLGYTKANKRSGKNINNPIKAMTPCRSGETIMACKANPGDMQMDTFALGGGNPCDNFFWALTGTDRKLQ